MNSSGKTIVTGAQGSGGTCAHAKVSTPQERLYPSTGSLRNESFLADNCTRVYKQLLEV